MKNFDIMNIDARLLTIFLSIYDRGSVSKTALAFDVTQSTISHSLDRLRTALGDPLFIKTGRTISPTNLTIELVPRVRQIVAAVEGLVESVPYDPLADTKPITIAANVTELTPELHDIKTRLFAANPKMVVRFIEQGSRKNLPTLLEQRNTDVSLCVHLEKTPSALERQDFFIDPVHIFYDPECRTPITSVADYCAAPHATLDFDGNAKSMVSVALENLGLERTINLGAANVYSLGQLIKGTDLIATMSQRLANSVFSHLAHQPPPLALPDVQVDMYWHRRYSHSPRNIWLRNFITGALAK